MEHLDFLVCVYWKIQSDFIFKLSGGIVMSQAKSILQAQPNHSLLEVIEDSYFIQYSSGGSISNIVTKEALVVSVLSHNSLNVT